jgi:hypothetical protein
MLLIRDDRQEVVEYEGESKNCNPFDMFKGERPEVVKG